MYTVSPDGRWGLSPDFRRLNDCRPGYGYPGLPDSNRDVLAPGDAGIWRTDMLSGDTKLIITIEQIAGIPWEAEGGYGKNAKSWFNHLLFSPNGERFIFLHRWRAEGEPLSTFHTRMFTAAADGSDLYIIDPSGFSSHFVPRDPEHVFLFTYHPMAKQRFYLFKDKSREVAAVGPDVMTANGHNTYLPETENKWVLNDTYPQEDRLQHPYLYHVPTDKRVPLGHFASPPEYKGEWRCDNHPRASRNGRQVCIDSPHLGGRQMYLIDVSGIVEG